MSVKQWLNTIEHIGCYFEHFWQYVNVSLHIFTTNLKNKDDHFSENKSDHYNENSFESLLAWRTFLNKASRVGIVYMATTAAFFITQGWCLARVLLYASWQQLAVLSASDIS